MDMDTIILAGGYAERLYPLTKEKAKPLLEIAGRPILSYLFEELNEFYDDNPGKCYLTINRRFQKDFEEFVKKEDPRFDLEIVVEDSTPETKPWPITAIYQVTKKMQKKSLEQGVMVIAGDSLSSLKIKYLVDEYKENPKNSIFALYKIEDSNRAKLYGVFELGERNRILNIIEKPEKPIIPAFVNTTCFILSKNDLSSLEEYIEKKPKKEYLHWLISEKKSELYGFVFEGHWFDIGDKESLEEANAFVKKLAPTSKP